MADKNQIFKKFLWTLPQTKAELEAYAVGVKLESTWTEITIGDNKTTWYLSFYPRGGNREKDKDHVAFFLNLPTAGSKEFKAKFTLGVIGTKGNKEHNCEKPGKSFAVGWGCSLLNQVELFDLERGYFADGTLTLYCKLTLSDDIIEPVEKDLPKQSVLSDIKRMLNEELFTDFKVRTAYGKVLKAHKGVLAARSPYCYEMLTSGLKGIETNVVKVPEDADIMTAVLSFIYSGKVENLDELADELVVVAQKYQLNELKLMCIESIMKNLSFWNVVETLLTVEGLTDSEELRKKCIDVIASNFEYLSTTAEWRDIPQRLFPEIIRHSNSEIKSTINI